MPPKSTQQREFVHPEASHAKRKAPTNPYAIAPISAFYAFFAANLISALFAPIQDCDETFNYWEPTHYLSHGYGMQTWEYSPDYALRSWLYIGLHAIVGNIRRLLPQTTKLGEFYFVRYVLAFVCALCQTLMFRVVSSTMHSRIGLMFVIATVLSPGNFHASTAYLPSSFAMYMVMLGTAAFMNWRGGLKTSQGMFWFAVGGLLGWPFAAALCAPFMVEEVVLMALSDKERFIEAIHRVSRGVVAALVIIAVDTAVNTFFYKKLAVVSWNIVKYNIFSSSGGPNLYGTEPWTFYFKNLALNFNIWLILALLAMPLFLLQKLIAPSGHGFRSGLRTVVFLTPFYMWLTIFTLQPHKEERFMYPAYPFLALNAAIALHILLAALGSTDPKTLIGKIPAQIKLLAVSVTALLALQVGLARITGIWAAYHAPLTLYEPLGAGVRGGELGTVGGPGDNVCFGKEWYRFPTSYFLPRDMHPKFIRSEFHGLLPGEFSEARTGFGFWSGTWLPPIGMNDRNEEDPGKYIDLHMCSFLVDTQYPENSKSGLPLPPNEPDYIADTEHWDVVKCVPFLDAANTSFLPRALYVPDWAVIPEKYRRKWGRHCLLQRRK